ncbi:cysteine/glutathione ABC transporter ATP-binding protein/permease CydC [Shimwellia pseudoproteus]|uniref:heme ABC transporter ATP-binding protein/permease CydC n=1 Tax=Shimwellia pseudoproteus TaxID=570012 RepID=UPI0018ECC84F|nr:cysteine/glutathione ABC transporter ATP-binding protein/permease CydC [Shimwellia pseudoproteus]MBJ3816728.1 cysteine/glutathione ABC transporter ATP-binding protein/permease CydC [Shimwellia pseudoproteus]
MRDLLPWLGLYRRHKGLLILGIILAIVTLLASIGLLTLSGWFLSASALAGVSGLYTFNYMLPAAGVRGAAIIRTAGRYFERLVSHDATFRVLKNLRVTTFSSLLPLSPTGRASIRQGDLLNRLVADVDTLDHLYLRVISPLIGALMVIIVVTFALSWLDLHIALTLGAILLFTLLLLPPLFYRAGKPAGEAITVQRGVYRQRLTDWLQGHAELTIFGASERYRRALDDSETHWNDAQRRQSELSALSQSMMLLLTALAVLTMLWMASSSVGGNRAPGALIALFVFCAMACFEALAPVSGAFQHLGQVASAAQRLSQITGQQPDVTFPSQSAPAVHQASLDIRDLSFCYPGHSEPVLRDITLHVQAGQRVVILGQTGCGKSTLLQLITRSWDPQHGEILLGDNPLKYFDEATLRASTSVVPQRPHLFSATLRDNLLLANPAASDDMLREVLEKTGLQALLDNDGLNGWIGEGGRQLSGGEARRMGIARALLHDAPLVLLDEPTEGLDAETERQIINLLMENTRGKTLLMVTHRLQGLAAFDHIIVMDNGEIIEQGNHAALLEKQGRYYQFRQRLSPMIAS